MKMKMKRSEYKRRLRANAGASEEAAEVAATVSEEAGVEWAPEEVEMPKTIHYEGRSPNSPHAPPVFSAAAQTAPRSSEEWDAIYREMEARYNALPELEALARELVKAGCQLCIYARTSGGTEGPDPGLMAACSVWEQVNIGAHNLLGGGSSHAD